MIGAVAVTCGLLSAACSLALIEMGKRIAWRRMRAMADLAAESQKAAASPPPLTRRNGFQARPAGERSRELFAGTVAGPSSESDCIGSAEWTVSTGRIEHNGRSFPGCLVSVKQNGAHVFEHPMAADEVIALGRYLIDRARTAQAIEAIANARPATERPS